MSECMTEVGGNGLVQYGKDDCTFVDGGAIYKSSLVLPAGITYGDVLQMAITQVADGQDARTMFKYNETSYAEVQQAGSSICAISSSATSISLPYRVQSAAQSITKAVIIVKK